MSIEKAIKKLTDTDIEEMDSMSTEQLQKSIAQSEESIRHATQERDENPHYVAAKQVCKDLSEGLNGVKNRQGAKIQYALHRLKEQGAL